MKKTIKILASFLLVLGMASCEKDNYDAPDATLQGQIFDNEGNPFQTANGQGSMAIRIVEESYANGDPDVTVTPQNLNMRQDGSYINTKLFAGTYSVIPYQGAFYEDVEAAKVQLNSGSATKVDFTVTPYLTLEWVKAPYIDEDGYLKASFKFKRNAKEGMTMPAPNECCMWISRTQYCGTEGDSNYTPGLRKITADEEGQEIELSSKIPIKYSMKYWVRIGANVNDTYKKYNFTDILTIDVKVK